MHSAASHLCKQHWRSLERFGAGSTRREHVAAHRRRLDLDVRLERCQLGARRADRKAADSRRSGTGDESEDRVDPPSEEERDRMRLNLAGHIERQGDRHLVPGS